MGRLFFSHSTDWMYTEWVADHMVSVFWITDDLRSDLSWEGDRHGKERTRGAFGYTVHRALVPIKQTELNSKQVERWKEIVETDFEMRAGTDTMKRESSTDKYKGRGGGIPVGSWGLYNNRETKKYQESDGLCGKDRIQNLLEEKKPWKAAWRKARGSPRCVRLKDLRLKLREGLLREEAGDQTPAEQWCVDWNEGNTVLEVRDRQPGWGRQMSLTVTSTCLGHSPLLSPPSESPTNYNAFALPPFHPH